jgi:hypothetical protein
LSAKTTKRRDVLVNEKAREDIINAVGSVIESANRYPFLFVGSGLSKRYLGTPSWEPLLRELSEKTIGPQEYMRLSARARTAERRGETDSALPYLAQLMEDPINDCIVTDEAFSSFRAAHNSELLAGISPMRMFIADMLAAANIVNPTDRELRELVRAGKDRVSGVITTNYDRLCETIFPDFTPYVGQDGLIFRDPCYSREIYEIHGSVNDPDSLVITESDYREFDRKSKYLAAKMLTVFMEYPIVFLGYSISDQNVRKILGEVCQCVGPRRLDDLRGRIVFVQYGATEEGPISTYTESFDGHSLSMVSVTTDDFTPIFEAIGNSKKLYNTRFIREIRSDIYNLASHIDPSREIVLAGVDNALASLPDTKKAILGIGIVGEEFGMPITAQDLYEDVVLDNKHFQPRLIVDAYLEILLKQNSGGLPIYKYLSAYNGIIGERTQQAVDRQTCVDSFRNQSIRQTLSGQRNRFAGRLSVEGLIEAVGYEKAYKHMSILDDSEIDWQALRMYLTGLLDADAEKADAAKSILFDPEFRRMVRVYDLLRYRSIYLDK